MFREMTRKHKEIPREECLELLRKEKRGVLSVIGDEGYPYGMPLNHFYDDRDGCLYFHCGTQESHRQDALRRCDKVSFCVTEAGENKGHPWALEVRSVILFGKARILTDWDTIVDISARLSRKFTGDERYIEKEIAASGPRTLLIKVTPEHICGKRVLEA